MFNKFAKLIVTVIGYAASARLFDYDHATWQAVITDLTPIGKSIPEADVTSSSGMLFTKANHGLTTGLKGRWTTVTTLPTGLSLATDYWVIKISENTFKMATSYANALAGTAIAFTDNGTGDHTFTATAIAGVTGKRQGSTDDENWTDIPDSSKTWTAQPLQWRDSDIGEWPYERLVFENTAGLMSVDVTLEAK